LRKAFADLRHRVDRHVARLKHESEFKRPARRRRIGAPLPPARDAAEAGRRQLFFGLIEDHLDTVYDAVRRELTYFECSGSVPQGYLSVRDLVDATILKGLERFERRPMRFSVGDWLTQLAFETIGEEPAPPAGLCRKTPPRSMPRPNSRHRIRLRLIRSCSNFTSLTKCCGWRIWSATARRPIPRSALDRHETALCLHRALSALPALWRQVLYRTCIEDRRRRHGGAYRHTRGRGGDHRRGRPRFPARETARSGAGGPDRRG
jgi:DNA-directed RNA polymerase specialized sigma24 family protein